MDVPVIVRGLRECPEQDIRSLWDLYSAPNSVLMSYFLEQNKDITVDGLVSLLNDLDAVRSALADDALRETERVLPGFVQSSMDRLGVSLSSFLTAYSGQKVWQFGDEFVTGATENAAYRFPGGKSLDYSLVVGEVSANMPVSTLGFCETAPARIYVRDNSLKMIKAYARVASKSADFRDVAAEDFEQFERYVLGIVLSHEAAEVRLLLDDLFENLPIVSRELEVERVSKEFLDNQGMPESSYLLFHRLRSMGDKDPARNVSYNVLQKFQPLSL
ncbi:hypothetical protein KY363_05555 [Candidatus Woesearchaeota archaeon]|nr:hypothetical protein [Candidatus Woesearchaeota archaeon]